MYVLCFVARMVKGAASAMAADLALGKEQHVAWDRSSILLVKAAKVSLKPGIRNFDYRNFFCDQIAAKSTTA